MLIIISVYQHIIHLRTRLPLNIHILDLCYEVPNGYKIVNLGICALFSLAFVLSSLIWAYFNLSLIPSVVFTNSSAMQLIFCLWCIIQPLPSVILNLSPHPYNLLCHSYNSVSDVQNSLCDPHNFFCHPQVYANELPAFLMMSSVFVV